MNSIFNKLCSHDRAQYLLGILNVVVLYIYIYILIFYYENSFWCKIIYLFTLSSLLDSITSTSSYQWLMQRFENKGLLSNMHGKIKKKCVSNSFLTFAFCTQYTDLIMCKRVIRRNVRTRLSNTGKSD